MKSTFSFSRLGKLITKQLFENAKLYTYSVLAIFGLLALVFAFWVLTSGPTYEGEATYGIFLFGLFIAGTIFASMSFNMLGSKDKGIYWLGLPATHLEKLVCTIFFTTVLFTLFYCLCFFAVKSLTLAFLKGYMSAHAGMSYTEMTDFNHGFGQAIKYFIYAYFAVQALYQLGSVYFARYSFVVTSVVTAIVIFSFAYYIHKLENGMFDGTNWDLISLKKYDPAIKDGYMFYAVSPAVQSILKFAIQFMWAPLFWVTTWYRLKEKEL